MSLAAQDATKEEITVKATGDFAKELQELIEKYQQSGANGSIEIVEKNVSHGDFQIDAPINTTEITKENIAELSPIEKAMQEDIAIDNVTATPREVYDEYYSNQKSGGGILGILLGEGKDVASDIGEGRRIYNDVCFKCHGERAEKSTYANARDLITLSKETIVDQVRAYKRDSGYGKVTGIIMRPQAMAITDDQAVNIAAYIETLKGSK